MGERSADCGGKRKKAIINCGLAREGGGRWGGGVHQHQWRRVGGTLISRLGGRRCDSMKSRLCGLSLFKILCITSPEPFVSRAKAPSVKKSEKGYGDEKAKSPDAIQIESSLPFSPTKYKVRPKREPYQVLAYIAISR